LEGKILILGNVISTLFDSGASHTFISHTVVKSLSLKTENTIDPLVVSNPIEGTSHLNLIWKDLVLDISNVEFYCCAYVLGFEGYGLILGMDWLSYYGAVLDCEKRIVRLKSRMGRDLCIHCTTPISSELGRLFSLNVSLSEPLLVPIVREFPDIFEEVSGLPPERKIEFKIELENDARPIALPLRPMDPRERRELEKQVTELL